MASNMKELKQLILKKNETLEGLCRENVSDKDKIRRVKTELDGLLYQLYKNYRFRHCPENSN